MQSDPLDLFKQEQTRARAEKDPMANLCMVASIDADGAPSVRTLVLREVDGQLAIFVNATSPKWAQLTDRPFAVVTFWPSVQIQYRLNTSAAILEQDMVHDSWQLRPPAPKQMDWVYESGHAQSSRVDDRDTLLDMFANTSLPEPLQAPESARGLVMQPTSFERLDLTMPDGVHDRTLYRRSENGWTRDTLIP